MISITIDPSRCEGHGLCELAAPSVYRLDADGLVGLVEGEIGPERLVAAQSGARVCPVNALTVAVEDA